jgi:hypothetical protein
MVMIKEQGSLHQWEFTHGKFELPLGTVLFGPVKKMCMGLKELTEH